MLITLKEAHSGPDSHYYGDNGGWLIAPELGTHRDADALTRSNYTTAESALRQDDPDGDTWCEESSTHWAAGWTANLAVKPGTASETVLRGMTERLESYPVLDEDHFSFLEFEEAQA